MLSFVSIYYRFLTQLLISGTPAKWNRILRSSEGSTYRESTVYSLQSSKINLSNLHFDQAFKSVRENQKLGWVFEKVGRVFALQHGPCCPNQLRCKGGSNGSLWYEKHRFNWWFKLGRVFKKFGHVFVAVRGMKTIDLTDDFMKIPVTCFSYNQKVKEVTNP